jgi:hypothetical protein
MSPFIDVLAVITYVLSYAPQIDGTDDIVFSPRAFRGHLDAGNHSDQPHGTLKNRTAQVLCAPLWFPRRWSGFSSFS